MNRNDLKDYYKRLKKGQQDSFVGESKLLREGEMSRLQQMRNISPDHDQQLDVGMFSNDTIDSSGYMATGGGLGRINSII